MNCPIEGTSSPTSLSMVLYCDNSLVHAGEYLFTDVAKHSPNTQGEKCTHSAAVTESRTYARSRYSRATMMPKRVAKRPYFSLSAFVEYSLTSSSRLSDEEARDMAVAYTTCALGVVARLNLDAIRSNLGDTQWCPEESVGKKALLDMFWQHTTGPHTRVSSVVIGYSAAR